MVNGNDKITVVLSEEFIVLSNSTKVLLWLRLAFVLCSPFKIKTIEKVNTGTSPLGSGPGLKDIRMFSLG